MSIPASQKPESPTDHQRQPSGKPLPPISNYTLSTVCPACEGPTFRHACKVRCPRCGFMWDCSEL